jgi:AhpD family alkylhydroperoxidase
MPRVPVHTTTDAPRDSQEALRGLERRMGRLLNIHAEMAHAPVVLAAYQGIQQAITKHGSFDAKTREAIALAVAAVDKCAYCQSAHTVGGQAAGWSLAETVAIRDGTAELDRKLAALLAVAREIAGSTGYVTDAAWQAALGRAGAIPSWRNCSPTWRRTCSPTTSTTTHRPSQICPPRPG